MAELLQYKCPSCGGAVSFDSGSQQMQCPYCDSTFDIETVKVLEAEGQKVGFTDRSDRMEWERPVKSSWREDEVSGMSVYSCQSCGGEVIGDSTLGSTSCPFCGNNIVLPTRFSGDLRPDYIIPFKLDKDAAKAALKRHVSGKKLVPKVFKSENHIDEIKGVYVPFWLFNCKADAEINYVARNIKSWNDSNFDYEETESYRVMRSGTVEFERVPVGASTKADEKLMESIEPFNWEDAVDFDTAYLAGYLANKYDISSEESIVRANERIKESTEESFADTVSGYDAVEAESSHISLSDATVNYALYPVWLLNTTWNGDKYMFAMNGQTGRFVGDLPIDKNAYWSRFAGFATAFGAVVYGLLWFLG